jgi:hypothetical protein
MILPLLMHAAPVTESTLHWVLVLPKARLQR